MEILALGLSLLIMVFITWSLFRWDADEPRIATAALALPLSVINLWLAFDTGEPMRWVLAILWLLAFFGNMYIIRST